jgi:hypothetical protein
VKAPRKRVRGVETVGTQYDTALSWNAHAQPLCVCQHGWRYINNAVREETAELLHNPENQPPPTPGGRERHPVIVIDPDGGAGQDACGHPDDPGLAEMGVQNLRPHTPQNPVQPPDGNQIAEGRQFSLDRDRVNRNFIDPAELVLKRTRRRCGVQINPMGTKESRLAVEEMP